MSTDEQLPRDRSDEALPHGHSAVPAQLIPLPTSFDLGAFPSEQIRDDEPLLREDDEPAADVSPAPPLDDERPVEIERPQPLKAVDSPMDDGASDRKHVIDLPARLLGPDRAMEPVMPADPASVNHRDAVTLADLIDRADEIDWRRAVAIVHGLCLQLQHPPAQHPVLLEPRNIEITPHGEVRLLRRLVGGDPLVIQLGRLLRTLLMGKPAPADVRLLLSQATFELPILDSVDDVERALRNVGRLEETKPLRPIDFFLPGAASTRTPAEPDDSGAHLNARSILPTPVRRRRTIWSAWRGAEGKWQEVLLIAAILLGLGALAGLVITRERDTPQTAEAARTAGPVGSSGAARPAPDLDVATGGVGQPVASNGSDARRPPLEPVEAASRAASPPAIGANGVTAGRRSAGANGAPAAVDALVPRPSPTRAATPAPPAVSPRESERRAAALVAEGLTSEAAIAFDTLVLNNPLYDPSRHELTPEAYSAFQASRRVLLPAIALREYGRAKSAMDSGNFDRALSAGNLTIAVLDRIEADPPANLREQAQTVVDEATQAKLAADDIIYSRNNANVIPPRPLSRQFPVTTPVGVPPSRVGVLEMIIGKLGDVEFVKLHTPLNRYHERMIVSAAKAWRYRPASKEGKPVRYRVTVTINLPESGTN